VVNGTVMASGIVATLTAAQFAQTIFVAGAAGANDDLLVTAYDGLAFSNHAELHVKANQVPVLTAPAASVSVVESHSVTAASLFSGPISTVTR